ncbi:hypothetical protein L9F63_018009 [Diploptera punctata]|uniref:Luciferin 4-monooxygenase n=1 Tax=Diploptera punctata TaxID=6984 RepID=A0AAD7ZXC6_DIPPU|nr:hypothetical protein L9F63_018009 [Diploptera punctata]
MACHRDSNNVIHGPEDLYPPPDVTLGKFISQILPLHEDRVALVDAETEDYITYDELYSKSLGLASYLRAQGVQPGDAISICSENSIHFYIPVLASFYLGAICAPLNPMYTTRELNHTFNISKPKFVFCSEKALKRVDEVARHQNYVQGIVVFGRGLNHKHIPFSSTLVDKSNTIEPMDGDPTDLVAVILCSSGTTGLPKGVMLTHANILRVMSLIIDPRFNDIKPDGPPPTIASFLPFFHAMAFISHLLTVTFGAKCIILKKFSEELLLKTVEKYKVTVMPLVPAVAVLLSKSDNVKKYDLSSLQMIQSGGSLLHKETALQMQNKVGVEMVRQGYGLTETTLGVLLNSPTNYRIGPVGQLVPAMLCKVVDVETGKNLGPNERGELCFKGPLIMKGYCNDPKATADMMDSEGFLHTGDIGYYDEELYFYVVDRMKELIKYKGYQVPPAELEDVLLTHPAVLDAGVTSIPDESAGELPVAFIVKQTGKQVTKQEIIKYVEERVSPEKRLRGGVIFIDAIPRTPSGKILRRQLKNLTKSKL